jgi:sugar (pentulose or hexulose) kinase
MNDGRLFIAADLGAGSGRVFLAGFQRHELMLEEIRLTGRSVTEFSIGTTSQMFDASTGTWDTPIEGVQIIGGGSQNGYLNQATATATGKPVLAGPVEATAMGNAVVQAIAAGRFASLADARSHVARHVHRTQFSPKPTAASDRAARRYAVIQARFTEGSTL